VDGKERTGTGEGITASSTEETNDDQGQIRGMGPIEESEKAKYQKVVVQGYYVVSLKEYKNMVRWIRQSKTTAHILYNHKEYMFISGEYHGFFNSDVVPPEF